VSNAVHEIGAAAERGVHYAGHKVAATTEYKIGAIAEYGPIAGSPGNTSARDQTGPAVFAPRGRARTDPGLKTGLPTS
jgi:hypothetical protein